MDTPVKLLLDGIEVASFRSYGYETPWASGQVVFSNQELFNKLIQLTLFELFFLRLDEQALVDAEEDKLCNEKLVELGISWQDIELLEQRWQIKLSNAEIVDISTMRFYENSFMEWRF